MDRGVHGSTDQNDAAEEDVAVAREDNRHNSAVAAADSLVHVEEEAGNRDKGVRVEEGRSLRDIDRLRVGGDSRCEGAKDCTNGHDGGVVEIATANDDEEGMVSSCDFALDVYDHESGIVGGLQRRQVERVSCHRHPVGRKTTCFENSFSLNRLLKMMMQIQQIRKNTAKIQVDIKGPHSPSKISNASEGAVM